MCKVPKHFYLLSHTHTYDEIVFSLPLSRVNTVPRDGAGARPKLGSYKYKFVLFKRTQTFSYTLFQKGNFVCIFGISSASRYSLHTPHLNDIFDSKLSLHLKKKSPSSRSAPYLLGKSMAVVNSCTENASVFFKFEIK